MSESNIVGIKQRIPFDIFSEALIGYLENGKIDEDFLSENLKAEFPGKDSSHRAFIQEKAIIIDPKISTFLNEHKDTLVCALKNKIDRNLITLALTAIHFPFVYQMASIVAMQLRLQDEVNTSLIYRQLGKKYALNENVKKAFSVTLMTLNNGGFINRIATGVYSAVEPISCANPITYDLWCESYFINNPLVDRSDNESLMFEPYFRYIKF